MSLKRVGEILEGLRGFTCPHCGAGHQAHSVGLVWEPREQAWRCLVCGCRVYEREINQQTVGRKLQSPYNVGQ